MSDEDRIALMVMVKEGKISTETALEVVSCYLPVYSQLYLLPCGIVIVRIILRCAETSVLV